MRRRVSRAWGKGVQRGSALQLLLLAPATARHRVSLVIKKPKGAPIRFTGRMFVF